MIMSVGHRVDPGFLAVSPEVTLVINLVVGCRYFLSTRPAWWKVTFSVHATKEIVSERMAEWCHGLLCKRLTGFISGDGIFKFLPLINLSSAFIVLGLH